jgi:hypothetical protein
MLGQIDILGQGTESTGAMSENWITLDSRKTTTINYTGPAVDMPESNIMYLGLYNPPDMVNPIFQDEVWDFQITDEIFTYPIGANPYTIAAGNAITGYPSGSDLPWMAYAWKTQLVNDPYNPSNPQWTNVTLWFRNDIKWQDGQPFTVQDINYTIYICALYGDSWDWASMAACSNVSQTDTPDAQYEAAPGDLNYAMPNFQQDGNPYTCSILVTSPSWLNLYTPLYQVLPYHLYKYIVPSNVTDAENGVSADGLHGLWPGEAAVPGNVLSGAPFTLSQLTSDPGTTLVGTGPFQYRAGSIYQPGNGITLDAYQGFFMTIAPFPPSRCVRRTMPSGPPTPRRGGPWCGTIVGGPD